MITQELLNLMMRYPWERQKEPQKKLPKCPVCEEEYLGDGIMICVECQHKEKQNEER